MTVTPQEILQLLSIAKDKKTSPFCRSSPYQAICFLYCVPSMTIRFTREQWKMLDDIFEAQIGFVAGEGKPGAVAMVKRHGIMTVRTVMVLCGYRIMEAGWVPILKRMPSRFAYSEFDTAVRNAGFGVCAAKRALKKYAASGLLSKSNGFHFKTSRLK